MRIIFFGTPEFCLPSLQFLNVSSLVDLCLVVSMPDRPAGRGQQLKSPPVIEFCKEKQIPYLQTEHINKDAIALDAIKKIKPDLIIVLAFAQFLSKEVLAIPKIGCFNIHTSLLPRWRGAAPIQHALLNGDQSTGVCIQRMVSKMDAGDICINRTIPLRAHDQQLSLTTRLQYLCVEALDEFIFAAYSQSLTFTPQDESKVTLAPEIKKDDGRVDFKNESAAEIISKYRAYTFWPGIFTFVGGKRLKLIKISEISTECAQEGFANFQGQLVVKCHRGVLRLEQIQWEGKKPVFDYEYLRSHDINELNH
jgi:methionyl-tRNA formyltransferase